MGNLHVFLKKLISHLLEVVILNLFLAEFRIHFRSRRQTFHIHRISYRRLFAKALLLHRHHLRSQDDHHNPFRHCSHQRPRIPLDPTIRENVISMPCWHHLKQNVCFRNYLHFLVVDQGTFESVWLV